MFFVKYKNISKVFFIKNIFIAKMYFTKNTYKKPEYISPIKNNTRLFDYSGTVVV